MVAVMLVLGRVLYHYCCEYMGGTRGSDCVYTADDVLEMSVMRGVICVCIWLGAGWNVWGERIGVGLYQSSRNR